MSFVEIQVLPGQWRVLSTNWSHADAVKEINLLRRFCPWVGNRVLRAVKVIPMGKGA